MSQKYKDKYEELRNNDLGTKQSNDDTTPKEEETYATPGNVRNIGFVWKDGRKMFLNYAYLVFCNFEIVNEISVLVLGFTSHTVTLKGFGLHKLYEKFIFHLPALVFEEEQRYAGVELSTSEHQTKWTVISIMLSANSA